MKDEQLKRAARIVRLFKALGLRELKMVETGVRHALSRRYAALQEDDPAAVEALRTEAEGWSDDFLASMIESAQAEAWHPVALTFRDVATDEKERRST